MEKIEKDMKMQALSIAVVTVICLSKLPAFGMAGDAHNDLSATLLSTPASEGGAAGMKQYKLEVIQRWMDNPATRTGQFMNRTTGTAIHPTNHGHLHHNPEAVSRALSGTGEIDPAVENVARLHKIADISINKAPVDGWEITGEMRQEARSILNYVEEHSRLPKRLPLWVDESGPLMKGATGEADAIVDAATAASTASKLSKAVRIGGGALGVVGGGVQVYHGVKEIQEGKKVSGLVDVVSGSSVTGAGAAIMAGKTALGGTLGGTAVVLDGVKDVYTGIRDGDRKRTGIGTTKTIAGGCMIYGEATGNPLVFGGGVVLYTGTVVYENWDAIEDGATSTWDAIESHLPW